MPKSKSTFEHKNDPLLPGAHFLRRQLLFIGYAIVLVSVSLGIGMAGYRYFTGMEWVDAFYNASMIFTGMGPVSTMVTPAAKIFASLYALFSSLILLSAIAVLFAPMVHRFLHLMHLE